MTTAATSSIIRVPAVVVANSSTYLGECRAIRFTPHPRYYDIRDEEYGAMVGSLFLGHARCEINAILRYPDADAIATCATANSGATWSFTATQTTRAGTLLSTNKIQIIPHASAAHPGVVLYAATCRLHEDAELRHSWQDEYGLGVQFVGLLDGTQKLFAAGIGV